MSKYLRLKKKYNYEGELVNTVTIELISEKEIDDIMNSSSVEVTEQWRLSQDKLSATKTFEINVDTFISVGFVGILEREQIDIKITEIGTNHEEHYAFDRNKNKSSVYTKDDYLIVSGTAVVEASPNQYPKGVELKFNYPKGFNQDNTMVISSMMKYYPGHNDSSEFTALTRGFVTGAVSAHDDNYVEWGLVGQSMPMVQLHDDEIEITLLNIYKVTQTFYYKVMFLKVD